MKKGGASCGLGFNSVPDIQSSLQVATANGYDFMVSFIYYFLKFLGRILLKSLKFGNVLKVRGSDWDLGESVRFGRGFKFGFSEF